MNKLATIQKIHDIKPHPNPEVEKLEVARVLEWPVVIPKGQYKEGELVVFIEIDSIVPESNPYFEFMRRQKFRIWNAKFRGCISQGLICPLSILTGYGKLTNENNKLFLELFDDVIEKFGINNIEKYIYTI